MSRRGRSYSVRGVALLCAALALPAAMQAQTVTRTLTFTPSSYNFGNLAVGSTSPTQTFTVKNTGNASVTFTGLTAGSFYFHVTDNCLGTNGGVLTAGSTCTFSAYFSPDIAGPLSASVTYTDNATGSPQSVALSGGGIGSKSITFPQPTTPVLAGTSAILGAYTSSGDPVTYSITGGTGTAMLSGSTITYTSPGTVTIEADSAASTYYTAAPPLAQTVTVNPQPGAYTAPTTAVGSTSATQTAYVNFTTAGTLSAINVLTQGTSGLDYKVVSGGTCATGTAYTVGQVCTVEYSFSPLAPGQRIGAIVLTASGSTVLGTSFLQGTGTGGLAGFTPGTITSIAGNGTTCSTGTATCGDGGAAALGLLSKPFAVAVDAAGNVYIADYNDNRVRKISASNGNITTIAGTGVSGYSGDGGLATSAELNNPAGVAVDGAGNVYISDLHNQRIRKITAATGIISTAYGNGTASFTGLSYPEGLAVDGAGNLYIAQDSSVGELTVAGAFSFIAGNGYPCSSPTASCGDGGAATAAQVSAPGGVAVDASGNIYIADTNDYRVREISASNGYISTVAGNGNVCTGTCGDGGAATSASINQPFGVAVDAAGNLYISEYGNYKVRKVAAPNGVLGNISTMAGSGYRNPTSGAGGYSGDMGPATSAALANPLGIALDGAANLYIADSFNNAVRKVTVSPAATVTFATGTQVGVADTTDGTQVVTLGNDGNSSFTVSLAFSNNSSFALNGCSGYTTVNAGASNCTFNVSFTPGSAGTINGAIDIYSSIFSGNGSTSFSLLGTGALGTPTVSLSATPSASTYGQTVQLQATVAGTNGITPTGTVAFQTGTTTLGTGTLAGGTYTLSTAALPLGMDTVTVAYTPATTPTQYYSAGNVGSTTVTVSSVNLSAATPVPIASNANGATLTVTGQNLPTTVGGPSGYAYCFYTGYGSLTPIVPTTTNPTVISVPASTINSIPASAYTNGVFTAKLYVIQLPFSTGVSVNCSGTPDSNLSNTLTVPIQQALTVTSFTNNYAQHNPAILTKAPPYTITVTGTDFIAGTTTANIAWTGGSANAKVTVASSTSMVVTVPTTIPSTVTSATLTVCNGATCAPVQTINLPDIYTTATGGLATGPTGPVSIGTSISLQSNFTGTQGPSGPVGVPSGTVTFSSNGTTVGTAKLTLDATKSEFLGVTATTVSTAPLAPPVTGDFNADGLPDVAFYDESANIHVLLGALDYIGTSFHNEILLTPLTNCNFINDMKAGDLNGDGFSDLAVDCSDTNGNTLVYIYLGNGDGSFATPTQLALANGTNLNLADMNKDGKLDIVLSGLVAPSPCSANCNGFQVFTGNGDGTFNAPVTTLGPANSFYSVAVADFNGDGYPDIAVLNNGSQTTNSVDVYQSSGATLLYGKASGTPGVYNPTASVALFNYPATYGTLLSADINKDGLPDVAVSGTNSAAGPGIVTALNTGSGGTISFAVTKTLTTPQAPQQFAFGDFTGDGYPDLVYVGQDGGAPPVYENDEAGNFAQTYTGLTLPANVDSVVAVDVNDDGYADVVTITNTPPSNAVTYSITSYVTSGQADANLTTTPTSVGDVPYQATWSGDVNFLGSSANTSIQVNGNATTTVLAGPTASNFGQTVTYTATVTSPAGVPAGNVNFLDGTTVLAVVPLSGNTATFSSSTLALGGHSIKATYVAQGSYATSSSLVFNLTVSQTTPTLTWLPSPNVITYGTGLVASQLNATAVNASATGTPAVPGTYTYEFISTPLAVGTLLPTGIDMLTVIFTPTDSVDYKAVSTNATITVNKFSPVVTWNTPAPIIIGTPLSATQLDATATGINGNLPGVFNYTPASGTMLSSGANQTLSVQFVPTDTTDYNTVTQTTTITVTGLTVSLLSPSTATIGSSATAVTLTGTGFFANSVVSINGTPVTTSYISPTGLSITVPAASLLSAQTLSLTVYDPTQNVTSAPALFTVTAPPVAATFTGPTTVAPAEQPSLSFNLTTTYPVALTATATLAFTGTGGVDDPSIQFSSGGRTLTFTVPANTNAIPAIQVQSGTDTGTITVTLVLTASGVVVTPASLVPLIITVPPAAPSLTSLTLTRSGDSITTNLIGYSNTRDLVSATFHFTGAGGTAISNPDITIPAAQIFATWFTSAASQQYGSAFLYTQQFNLNQDQSTVGSVTVTLTNSAGTSTTLTAQ